MKFIDKFNEYFKNKEQKNINNNKMDELYKFLFIAFFVIWVINIFLRNPILLALWIIDCLFIIYRAMLKNPYKRQNQNMKYLAIRNKILEKFKLQIRKWKDRKSYIYRKCPNCKAEIRLPRKKGKHVCTCPRCKKDFDIKCN